MVTHIVVGNEQRRRKRAWSRAPLSRAMPCSQTPPTLRKQCTKGLGSGQERSTTGSTGGSSFRVMNQHQIVTSRPLTVLYAGSFRPWKRVELVIEQAARWPNVQFRLAGRGETEEACRACVESTSAATSLSWGISTRDNLGKKCGERMFFFSQALSRVILRCSDRRLLAACQSVAMNVYHPEYVLHGRDWLPGRVGCGTNPEVGCAPARFGDAAVDGVGRCPTFTKI